MKAIYPGSFNLFHAGHYQVYKQACDMFGKDNVQICVAANPAKDLDLEFIQWTLRALTNNVTVTSGLVAEAGADFLVRGLRDTSDVSEELSMADWNRELGVETVFIPTRGELRHVSSSALRMLYGKRSKQVMKHIPKECEFTFHRWARGRIPQQTIFCGKIGIGKSTYLKDHYGTWVNSDVTFWKGFSHEDQASIKGDIKAAIMAEDYVKYENLIDSLAILLKDDKCWHSILGSYKSLAVEAPSLGQWFKHIPKNILSKFKIVELQTSDDNRRERLASRKLSSEVVEKFDRFYKTPDVVDEVRMI